MATSSDSSFTHITFRMVVDLAAPHTWPASVLPALIGICLAGRTSSIPILLALALLLIVVLMQSSVNTFNDYFDYVKGTDTIDADVAADDAVLVYNHIRPRTVLMLAVGFLVGAFLLGIYIIFQVGVWPLTIAIIGALCVVLYSGGHTPISYLPIGELVSGLVMGGLILVAIYVCVAGSFDLVVIPCAVPTIIGVGLIMFTNNTCDIERDSDAGRNTFPIILGRQNARACYRIAVLIWILDILLNIALFSSTGLVLVPFMILCVLPLCKALFENPLSSRSRRQAMSQILSLNIALGAFYAAEILSSASIVIA